MDNVERLEEKIKRYNERLAEYDKQIKKLNRLIKAKRKKEAQKRTFEKGRIVAQLQAAYDPIDPLPIVNPAPKVTKKADPEGYAKYKAYLEYQEALAEKSAKISPEETKKWLLEQVETAMVLNALRKALRVRDDGKLEFDYSSEYYNIIANWYEKKAEKYQKD